MPYLDHNGYKLFYEVQGQEKNTLIFIHGLCGDHRVWSKNVPAFIEDYRVITIDMFGHGQSSTEISPQMAFDAMPTVIRELIEKEALQKVVLIGHSIAGNILLGCIEKQLANVNGYVFVDCAFNATERIVSSRNKLADSLLTNTPEQINSAIKKWYGTMMDMNADPQDNELILSAVRKVDSHWVLNFLKATNIIRKIPQTNLPTLIIESNWLTKDEPERSFYRVMPQAHYERWSVPHHFFFVYEPEKFNQQLRTFLEQLILGT